MRTFFKLVISASSSLRSMAQVAAAISVFGVTIPGAAAQSVFEQSKEISPADAAAKLLQAPKPDDTGLSNELAPSAPSGSSPLEGNVVDGNRAIKPPVTAGKLGVMNCTGKKLRVRTYNPADIVYVIPFQDKTINPGDYGGLDCASSKCKVQIGNAKPSSPIAGGYKYDGSLQLVGDLVSCN